MKQFGMAPAMALAFAGAFAGALLPGGGALAQTGDAAGLRLRQQIQNDPVAPAVTPRGHDVTVVVFADYQCSFCRKMHPVLEQLLRDDAKVKVLYRDWPVFGPPSEQAARAAIASRWQGRHAAFNHALMTMPGRVSAASIRAAANKAGVDWARLQADLKAHELEIDQTLSRNGQYAAMLGIQGTPSLVIGSYLIPGAIDAAGLRRVIAMARSAPKASGG